jgi:hypothetical protein
MRNKNLLNAKFERIAFIGKINWHVKSGHKKQKPIKCTICDKNLKIDKF